MVVVSALTVVGVGADPARENRPLDGAEEPERAFLDMTGLTDKEVRRSTCSVFLASALDRCWFVHGHAAAFIPSLCR